jgi:PAS domain S-box-containing protein
MCYDGANIAGRQNMSAGDERSTKVEQLLESPKLADALESNRFKQFLDHIPFAVVVAELQPEERITYVNLEFERLTGQSAGDVVGKFWTEIAGDAVTSPDGKKLSQSIFQREDHIGTFTIDGEAPVSVDAWSHVIQDDHGNPTFRLVALARSRTEEQAEDESLREAIQAKDTLLKELQHRVKNNLQMITALIRLEARNHRDEEKGQVFERLAGRINALALLYHALSAEEQGESVDLGAYLSQVASAVMQAHAVEGIRLDLKVDTWPVSVNVAMPTGLVVNELLTNALKHAFVGREHGTITLEALVDDTGCRVNVADDGAGLPDGVTWPQPGKLSALIVQSLRQNAEAKVTVDPGPGSGVKVSIFFARASAEPEAV